MLKAFGLRPKHRLGQNFLHDQNQMDRVVAAAQIDPGGVVLEVGAGTGALSTRLLDAGAGLVTVEIDRELEPILQQQLAGYQERVSLVIGDVLEGKHAIAPRVTDAIQNAVEATATETGQARAKSFQLIANLPYSIASPLLVNLVAYGVRGLDLSGAVVMIQREVADRLCAGPGTKIYGALSVMVQARCRVERIGTVSPNCFWPRPKVDSTIIRLTRLDQSLTDRPGALGQTLHRLFSQRRKQIATILGRNVPLPQGIAPDARPEQLTVKQLIAISDSLNGC